MLNSLSDILGFIYNSIMQSECYVRLACTNCWTRFSPSNDSNYSADLQLNVGVTDSCIKLFHRTKSPLFSVLYFYSKIFAFYSPLLKGVMINWVDLEQTAPLGAD